MSKENLFEEKVLYIEEENNSTEEQKDKAKDNNEEKKEDKENDEIKKRKEELKSKLRDGLNQKPNDDDEKNRNIKKTKKLGGKFNFKAFIMLLFIITIAMSSSSFLKDVNTTASEEIAYSQFIQKIEDSEIKRVDEKEGYVYGEVAHNGDGEEAKKFRARMITYRLGDDPNMMKVLKDSKVEIASLPPQELPFLVNVLVSWFPMLLLIGVWIFMLNRMNKGSGGGPQIFNMGKSKAKDNGEEISKVTFADVAGIPEAKVELEEVVSFLKEPEKFKKIGAKIPKGVLLLGGPGTGKTLLAKAVAGEAKVPFFSMSGSEFVEMFVGVGASRVRDLFEQAKKSAPSLVFIDEIDAVGRQRGAGLGGGHDEREQTLNQLLVEMDGFGANEGIIMIAATNRPDILDPALLRPGRFDRQIVVGRPDRQGREAVLKVHTTKKPLDPSVSLEVLAKRTPGFSGADLENLANEAALLAVRKDKKTIGMDEFEEAITRVIAGPEKKSRTISEHDRKLTAYHEAGHAVVMKLLKHSDPVHEISIIPRGMAGGYTMHLPTEDRAYTSKEKLKDEMVGLLGGRVAEKLILGDISTGAKNDIDRASAIARSMVMEYGMSDEIGTISYGSDNNEVFLGRDLGRGRNFSEEVGAKIDIEIKKFISEAYDTAESLLKTNISKLHAVAIELLDKEKIDGKEFEAIFDAN